MADARTENLAQNLRFLGRLAAALPVVVAIPLGVAAAAGLAVAKRAWDWAGESRDWDQLPCTDGDAGAEFTLSGLPSAVKKRFQAELLVLCKEMARAAARADEQDLGEGTP